MNRRPLLASTAALAALALATASGTASAATAAPAAGAASSTLSLLHVLAGGHDLSAVDLALVSSTTSSPLVSRIEVTPVTADGTGYGRQVVDQSNSPQGISALTTPGALAPFAALTSPSMTASADGGPSNQAGAASLGSVKLLGLPVGLGGALKVSSAVSGTSGAVAGKTVTLQNVSLPGIGDLLAALGLDASKLPVSTLSTLVTKLGLVTSTITTAQNAVTTAQAAVNTQLTTLAGLTATLTTDQNALTAAQGTLTTATTTLQGLLALPIVSTTLGYTPTLAQWEALVAANDPLVATVEGLVGTLAAAQTSYANALSAVNAAQAVVATAQAAVNAAQTLLATLQATLATAVSTLVSTITGVLDNTPLVSLAKLEVSTKAAVTSAVAGGQTAQVVGGTVTGLKVLGTDVLKTALGSTTVDLSALVGSTLSKVTTTVSGLTGTLSSVLSTVPSLPVLDIPAPKIGLLTQSTTTSISGGFGRAITSVTGLSITLPSVTIPSSVALPGAASLPALSGVTQVAGKLVSAPVAVNLLSLKDQAAFHPAAVGTTGTGTGKAGTPSAGGKDGGLPNTGLPVGVAVLSIVLVGGGLALRRKLLSQG